MFDIAFTELMVIGVIALLVIGPERLPKVARTAGQWLGRLNRYVSQVKQDIDRDMKLDELRKMQQEMQDSAQRYEILAGDTKRELENAVEQETGQISRVMQAMSATDGGLTMNEWDKIKAEEAAAASLTSNMDSSSASDSATSQVEKIGPNVPTGPASVPVVATSSTAVKEVPALLSAETHSIKTSEKPVQTASLKTLDAPMPTPLTADKAAG
jgi:sec-independent protein translocase protein TatB